MAYYLLHHFDPTFDYLNLKPRQLSGGHVDFYNLGYVQNVRRGDVLAEWKLWPPEVDDGTIKCVYDEKLFPAGPNTCLDPDNPDRLLAAADGYVFYLDGFITVKRTLNVRRDVDFHTGNIFFRGNVVVHGSVRSGFEVRGVNVMVKDIVEGADVRAEDSVVVESGIKGGGKAEVRAERNIRAPFAENARLLAGRSLLIDGACMHCDVYSGHKLAVKGMLVGGRAVSSRLIFVGEQLGGGLSTETNLILGYDAVTLYKAHLLSTRIRELTAQLDENRSRLERHPELRKEFFPIISRDEERLALFKDRHNELWKSIHKVKDLENCAVVVPGRVRPGVEVTIGEARLVVDDYLENVRFQYRDYEVVIESPALRK
ncbi:hypothetical protein GGQ74_002123 [Desulfobaculum xiamenense]|uniref:DUF342 domain-containing protein n=1 Tax=Desulfobaculum xiamenense TaxID=995050 RepID=A0A846QN56_9BACT|nr:FapA family protein [Desulfobaculum xiamenense]NJB68450.1 hypothetical protein [Desulfobaculum xiamenense]